MSVSPQDLSRAEAYGRLAARTGKPITVCPYEANGSPDQRVQARSFVSAYLDAGGKIPVDYGDGKANVEFSEQQRAELAAAGNALPDGSYPIPDCEALENAVQAYGRAPESHRPALRALIRRRNEELSCGYEGTLGDG